MGGEREGGGPTQMQEQQVLVWVVLFHRLERGQEAGGNTVKGQGVQGKDGRGGRRHITWS